MANRDYVIQQYRELLGRDPDPGGLRHYMGYSNPGEVRSSILGSAEYRNRTATPAAPPPPPDPWKGIADQTYNELQSFDKNSKSSIDIYNTALESLGLSDARTRVSSLREQLMNTENLLRNVEGSVKGRTQESLVTEAQKQRLVAMEQAPISESLRVQNQGFDLAEGDYNRILGEGKVQADLQIQDQITKRQAIIDRLEIAKDNAKSAEDKRRWETEIQLQREKMAEDRRRYDQEFELKKVQAVASTGRSGGGGGRGRGGGSSGSGAGVTRKSDGGFAFTDANGAAISAAKYAQITGQSLGSVLSTMGSQGDSYAAQVYNQLKADPFISQNIGKYKQYYPALFWGT